MTRTLNEIAALIHKDMCDDDRNGYSWSPRFGEDGAGMKTIEIDGKKYTYDLGSYDCSSSTKKAWELALGRSLNCSTTYDFKSGFLETGLFEWMPMSFEACPGDLYLDEDQHVAMCQSQVPDMLSEFCINEKGGVYGGQPGDQTGWEAYVHEFYDNGNWDGILHYKGGKSVSGSAPQARPQAVKVPKKGEPVKFRVSTDPKGDKWLVEGRYGVRGAGICWIAMDGVKRYRVFTQENGWLDYVTGYDIADLEDGCAGDGSPITAIEIDDNSVMYAARAMSKADYYPWMVGKASTDVGDSDHFAGDLANQIDGFKAFHAKA